MEKIFHYSLNNPDEALEASYSDMLELEGQGTTPNTGVQHGRVRGPPSEFATFSRFGETQIKTKKNIKKSAEASTTVCTQEKNRSAQKRFRDRQKARIEQRNQQLKFASEELTQLEAENTALIKRYNILEKILCLKDEQICSLLNDQPAAKLDTQYQENTRSLQEPLYTSIIEDIEDVNNAGKLIDPEVLKSISGTSLLAYWKKLVGKLGVLLLRWDEIMSDKPQEKQNTTAKISSVLCQVEQVWSQTALLNPTSFQLLIQTRLDGGGSGTSVDDKTFWTSVVTSMQLNHKQECQIVALKDIFTGRMKKILAARQSILGKMQLLPAMDRPDVALSVISETRRIDQAIRELYSNLQDEHVCTVVFLGSIFKTVLSPLQKARCIVQSYPFHPDMLQIASIISESNKFKMENQSVFDKRPLSDGDNVSSSQGQMFKMLKSSLQ